MRLPYRSFILLIACVLLLSVSFGSSEEEEDPGTTEEEERDINGPFKSSPRHFLRLYERYSRICKGENNCVPARGDGFSSENQDVRIFPWSLHAGTLHHYMNLPFVHRHGSATGNASYPRHDIPYCNSMEDITSMIKEASIHHRPKCKLAWFSPASICKLFHHYALVIFAGDSLTRHVGLAFHAMFREDWRFGAFPPFQKTTFYDRCSCDGQFSEHAACRSWEDPDKDHVRLDFRQLGLCTQYDYGIYSPLDPFSRTFFVATEAHEVKNDVTCDHLKNRLAFVQIQGGMHYGTDSQRTIDEYIKPFLARLKEQFNNCFDKVHIVFRGTIVCADFVEKKYPNQDKALAAVFNHNVSTWLRANHPRVHFLDPWNITREATQRTSDGCHSLTEVNFLLALTLLNMMLTHISV